MPNLQIGPEFFKTERNTHINWPDAFWRELLQNSLDAKATHIHIDVDKDSIRPDGKPKQGILISFQDDGCGMSRSTIEDVYFMLGASTKAKSHTIGGFGKARMMTCFSHYAYGIRTLNNCVEGTGSEYEIYDLDEPYDGCEVWVDVDSEGRYCNFDMTTQLKKVLRQSYFSCCITSNISSVDNFSDWLVAEDKHKDLSFGSVYTCEKISSVGEVVVRVHGVPMFSRFIQPNLTVVVEIDPAMSRECLTATRDALKGDYKEELDQFIDLLSVDRNQALRSNNAKDIIVGDDNISCLTCLEMKLSQEPEKNTEGSGRITMPFVLPDKLTLSQDSSETSEENGSLLVSADYKEWFDDRIPTFLIVDDTADSELKKQVWLFNPYTKQGQYFGRNKRKLARLWAASCHWAIYAMLKVLGGSVKNIQWRPGYIFSDFCLAQHRQISNGVHDLLIKPVCKSDNGENYCIAYKTSSREDRKKMLKLAAHEVSHISAQRHDEEYVHMLEDILEWLWINDKMVFRQIDSIV